MPNPTPRVAQVHDPAEKRLRALMMLEMRVRRAASMADIAKEFNVSEDTVRRALTYARQAGLVAEAEDKILQELVPAAHDAILRGLANPDAEAAGKLAIEVFKGTMSGFQKGKPRPVVTTAVDDLASYINQLRGADSNDPRAIDGIVVEGEAFKALPAAAESSLEEGADGAYPGNTPGNSVLPPREKTLGE